MKMEQYGILELAAHPRTPPAGVVIVYCLTSDKNIYSKDSTGEVRKITNNSVAPTSATAFKVVGSGTSTPVGAGVSFEPDWDTVVFDTAGTFGDPQAGYYNIPVTGYYSVGAFIMATAVHLFNIALTVYDDLGVEVETILLSRPTTSLENNRVQGLVYAEENWAIAIGVTNATGTGKTYEIGDSEFYGFLVN